MSKPNCYDADTCLHVSQLCNSCKRNTDLDEDKALIDHYEFEIGKPCPVCGNPLIHELGKKEADYCWHCNKNLNQLEREKKK